MLVIATPSGLIWKDRGQIAIADMTGTEALIYSRLPIYYSISKYMYAGKDNGNLIILDTVNWICVKLTEDALRFIRVYDKGARLATGGGNSAVATIEGVTINGCRTCPGDALYTLSTLDAVFTVPGLLMQVMLSM